jgi:hypothetical protein
MVDRPVIERARKIIDLAIGLDVEKSTALPVQLLLENTIPARLSEDEKVKKPTRRYKKFKDKKTKPTPQVEDAKTENGSVAEVPTPVEEPKPVEVRVDDELKIVGEAKTKDESVVEVPKL